LIASVLMDNPNMLFYSGIETHNLGTYAGIFRTTDKCIS
jgi:hypothetical protein